MYPLVCSWLKSFLSSRHRRSDVQTHDTSAVSLYRLIEQKGLEKYFPEYLAYDIRVDITGVVRSARTAHLALVECKLRPITLKDISQLIGYCKVARPELAWILSPAGMSARVSTLLKAYHRYDVLEFQDRKCVRIATWIHDRGEIDLSSVLPPG